MFFDSNIEPCCIYCRHGKSIGNDEIACVKRGVMPAYSFCGRFRYEPTKRVPDHRSPLDTSGFSQDDFIL